MNEFGDVLAAGGWDVEFPGVRGVVVGWIGVTEIGTDLPGEIGAFAGGVMKTIINDLSDNYVICGDCAILFRLA